MVRGVWLHGVGATNDTRPVSVTPVHRCPGECDDDDAENALGGAGVDLATRHLARHHDHSDDLSVATMLSAPHEGEVSIAVARRS